MSKKERKLTPAEQKRKADFEKICVEMEQKGYLRTDLTVSVLKANILAFVIMLPFVIAALVLFSLVIPDSSAVFSLSLSSAVVFFAALLLLTVLHEAIHGLTWGLFAKGRFKSISFGVIWQMLTPYCTCSEPLTRRQYIIGGIMPTLILGFGLAGLAAGIESYGLFVLSGIMIFGGGGDFLIILKLLQYRRPGKEVLYYDHPYECGVVAFEKL